MARQNRGDIFDPSEVSVLHCIQRAVRRAMLCGNDPITGRSHGHRRNWIRDRLEELAGIFGVDVLGFAILGNHLHVILRNRPDVVQTWSDDEVARRWWRLFPRRREPHGAPAEPQAFELRALMATAAERAEKRRRLSDISWVMRCLAEVIARRANQEDQCTGRFWEGRFKSQKLVDEAAILACSAYVDLNPVRAGIAETPEQSDFTSVQERILSEKAARRRLNDAVPRGGKRRAAHPFARRDRWLAPVELKTPGSAGPSPCIDARASHKGFLEMSLREYLKLLDWTGRQLKQNRRGSIPPTLAPILERVGLCGSTWCELVGSFGKRFRRVAGRQESLAAEAASQQQRWLQAPGVALMSG